MKVQVLFAVLLAGACVHAEANQAIAVTSGIPNQDRAYMRRFGGWLKKPGSAQGKVVVLNAQKRVDAKALASAISEIETRLRPNIELKTAEVPAITAVADAVKAAGGNLGVVLADQQGLPALLAAPEEGWAVVNVAKLADGNPAAEVLAARVRKEVLRAFALVAGGAFMAADAIMMRPDIHTPADLDRIKVERYGIDICRAIDQNLPKAGVVPWKVTTYAAACQEGWAPQPTNEFQKAVWDKVRELPTKPLPLTKPTR